MSALSDLLFESTSILSVKEEVEISDTQLQEQIFDRVEVKHLDQCVQVEKQSAIINEQCYKTEDNQTRLNDRKVINEQPCEYLENNSSSVQTNDDTRSPPKKNYQCSFCEKAYRSRHTLEVHMNYHTGRRPYACSMCPKRFAWPNNFRRHNLTHDPFYAAAENCEFKCTLCEKSFPARLPLYSHMNTHRGERPFKCEHCPKSFTSKNNLLTHSRKHTDVRKYECTLCNRKFIFDCHRRKHEKTHSNDYQKNHQCENCKRYFKLECDYRSHVEDGKCKGYARDKPFQCIKCEEESFASLELLSKHNAEIHPPPKKNHTCSVCPKSFWSKDLLTKHKKTHSYDNRYECTLCNKKFIYESRRLKHEKTHSNNNMRYQCEICKKYFHFEDAYHSHLEDNKCKGNLQQFHGVRDNEEYDKQIQAEKKMENAKTNEKSQKDDAFEKKYKCEECDKKFICRRNLNFHLRSHRKISSA